jgi:hypothetical protein
MYSGREKVEGKNVRRTNMKSPVFSVGWKEVKL